MTVAQQDPAGIKTHPGEWLAGPAPGTPPVPDGIAPRGRMHTGFGPADKRLGQIARRCGQRRTGYGPPLLWLSGPAGIGLLPAAVRAL